MIRKILGMTALALGLTGSVWADQRVAIEVDNQTNKIIFVELKEHDAKYPSDEDSYAVTVSAKQKRSEITYLDDGVVIKLVRVTDGVRESDTEFQLPYALQGTDEPKLPDVHKFQVTDKKGKLVTKVVN